MNSSYPLIWRAESRGSFIRLCSLLLNPSKMLRRRTASRPNAVTLQRHTRNLDGQLQRRTVPVMRLFAVTPHCFAMELLVRFGNDTIASGKFPRRLLMATRDEFVRVKEAAELLGVCTNTVRSWGAAGKIPEHRHPINNYRLYKRKDLERILKAIQEPPRRAK